VAYADPVEQRAYSNAWTRQDRAKNPEKYRERARRKYLRHREAILASNAARRVGNEAALAAQEVARRAATPVRVRRDSHLRRHYGISIEQYEELLVAQKGGCAICTRLPSSRPLEVDHDHETGRVRGLLCRECNLALGKLGENAKTVGRAYAYMLQQAKP
jgi:hypothetical protein